LTLFCPICDDRILDGEPRQRMDGKVIHRYCSMEGGNVCTDQSCYWWMTDHQGPCDK
jgi:hypothetical protein